MSQDKIFADGFIFKRRENAPDFVIGNISVESAIEFLKAHDKNGWVNLNVLNSKGGTAYIELDQFVPKKSQDKAPDPAPAKEEEDDGLPF
jgi:hypothetical protein